MSATWAGCADALGNTQATISTGATITNAGGSGLTAPVAPGHNPWDITNQSGASIVASGSGIEISDGGDTITNEAGATITSTAGNAISAAGGISIDGGSGSVSNRGTIIASAGRAIDFGVTSSGFGDIT